MQRHRRNSAWAMGCGAVVMVVSGAWATVEARGSELPFLEIGQNYVIKFADADNVFKYAQSGVTPTYMKNADGTQTAGKPATWTIQAAVEVFGVVEVGPGAWVRLSLPVEADEFMAWNLKWRAKAQLSDENVAELNKSEDGQTRLAKLRAQAEREIATTTAWVNLSRAVAILDVPSTLIIGKPRVSVNVSEGAE